MLTNDAIQLYGTKAALAAALGIRKQAVQTWGELVPALRAAQLERLTCGRLKFDIGKYKDRYAKCKEAAAARVR